MNTDNTELSISERNQRDTVLAGDQAFTAALRKAIKRGREKIAIGTYVDATPLVVRALYGATLMSACGSPAAMCVEIGGPTGALSLK